MRWLALLCVVGCGGSGGLTPDEVSHLPPGDAVGTALSGPASVQIYVAACDGHCLYGQQSVCDVGQMQEANLTLVEQDGHLEVDVDSSQFVVSRLTGGVWRDGRYDVGGWGTQLGGAVEVIARATGTLSADHQLTGQAHVRVTGDQVECAMTLDLR